MLNEIFSFSGIFIHKKRGGGSMGHITHLKKLGKINKHLIQSCDYYVDLGPSFVEIDSVIF